MKKLITLTAALAITGTALFAQKVSFGIKGGVQQTSIALKADQGDNDYKLESPSIGFQIGGVADIAISSHFSVQPNLLFNYRSGQFNFGEGADFTQMSVDIPINALYRHNGFFIGAGPNISYALSGKAKPFDDAEEDMEFYEGIEDEDAPIKRFEIGVNALMGYQFPSGFGISANFTRGLNNLVNDDDQAEVMKFNFKQFGLTFSYMFNAKKK